ncbi:kinase-like domain-containing protein [Xylariales sp. AK1849]|nr:kinase-like domain-containing protein [Xylariales sp. AK1849]
MKRSKAEASIPPALQPESHWTLAQTLSSASSPAPERGEPPHKLRQHRSRIKTALRSLTNSATSGSFMDRSSLRSVPPLLEPAQVSAERRRLTKRFSFSGLRTPFSTAITVVRRQPKPRPSLRTLEKAANEPLPATGPVTPFEESSTSNSNSNSNTNSSGKSSGPTNETDTTAKTSLDSKSIASSSKETNSGDKKLKPTASIVRRKKQDLDSPELGSRADSPLEPIVETAFDHLPPTILTVETAAAAKIYLETYYNDLLSKPSPRSMRLQYLESQLYNSALTPQERVARRQMFYTQETHHLRETRVLKTRSIGATMQGLPSNLASKYDVLKILGKGSFGVVRLVRERSSEASSSYPAAERKPVYAMKVIRKSTMLRTCQEGHLRAERDFLISSEGSRWIVPLITSFQDPANLYLVMEYMPGGDFLGLLIRENILTEPVAKFYAAEMILCIEEAHSLRCIHRDIKPDNFLVSASGHLMISDFGLAFDGHWSHDASYYHTHRYSLVDKLGLSIEGDATDRLEGFQGTLKWAQNVADAMRKHDRKDPHNQVGAQCPEPLLNWRNRCGNRTAARSVWSLGVILYECLYGHTPFLSEEGGRQETKRNIVNHRQTFAFPPRPLISRRCMGLIAQLVTEKEKRLCSTRYQIKDQHSPQPIPSSQSSRRNPHDGQGRSVFPRDAEDIKAHKWFRDVSWDRLHLIPPPFVPQISSLEDTHYFDEEEPISDWSESLPDTSSEADSAPRADSMALDPNPLSMAARHAVPLAAALPSMTDRRTPVKVAQMQVALSAYPKSLRTVLAQYVATPYDPTRLQRIHREIEHMPFDHGEQERVKGFVKNYGRKERKRPRDRLLRDRLTKATVLEIRKQSAFLGYTWKRVKVAGTAGVLGLDGAAACAFNEESANVSVHRAWYGGGSG